MKRFTLSVLMVLVIGGAMYAAGSQENRGPVTEGELTTLTGILDMSGDQPVLSSGGEEYVVMIPRIYDENIVIADGTEVTLEGYVHEGYGRYVSSDKLVISVTEAVVNGETYTFDSYHRGTADAGNRQAAGRGIRGMDDYSTFGGSRYARRR